MSFDTKRWLSAVVLAGHKKKINRFKKGRLTNADDLYFQLLTSLMPRAIIQQLKRGMVPKPEIFDNTTVFFSDIVSFTQVSGILLS